jgi:electron transfer flavoprotein alpha subunit
VDAEARTAVVERESDDGLETVEVPLPVLLTAAERLTKPPKISPEMMEGVKDVPIAILGPADIGVDPGDVGLGGSPTWVAEIYSVKSEREPITVEADDPGAAARQVVQLLEARGALDAQSQGAARQPLPAALSEPVNDRDIWVVAEIANGSVSETTHELLAGAVNVARSVRGTVAALVIDRRGESYAADLAAHGAQTVLVVDDPSVESYSPELYGHILAEAIRAKQPWAVLAPASSRGRDFTPRAAARLGLGLTGDVVGLEISEDGLLRQLKPAFGGTIIAPILSKTVPQVATVRPGMLEPYAPDASRKAQVERLAVKLDSTPRSRILSREVQGGEAAVELEHADTVVCVGAGIGGPENLHFANDLAEAIGGTVGATRKVVDLGWLPRQFQIGLTGKVLAPHLYIGIGVRGAFNHMIGVQRAGTIVAINNDPEALLMTEADIAVVGDYEEIVPALAQAVREARTVTV